MSQDMSHDMSRSPSRNPDRRGSARPDPLPRVSPRCALRGAAANVVAGVATGTGAPDGSPRPARVTYLVCLAWAFTVFNAVRLLTYLPTIWAIHQSAASDQHSLLTWLAWFGANLTMGLWLYEQADQRLERAALVNFGNAAMCFVTGIVIMLYR